MAGPVVVTGNRMIAPLATIIGTTVVLVGPIIAFTIKHIEGKIAEVKEGSDIADAKQEKKIDGILADNEAARQKQLNLAVEAAYEKGLREGEKA